MDKQSIEETIPEWHEDYEAAMSTIKFKNDEELNDLFDCRYGRSGPFPCTDCPKEGMHEKCDAAFFLVMEGRPALGDRIEIGNSAIETVETADGDFAVVEQLSLAEIAVIREFDTARGDDWDAPCCRATQAECDELTEELERRGFLAKRSDKGWEGYADATEKGRAQYQYWTGEARR